MPVKNCSHRFHRNHGIVGRLFHPGEILREELAHLGLPANAYSKKLFVPTNRINPILNESRSVTADTALRVVRFFISTPEFWLNLQCDYDLKVAEKKFAKQMNKFIQLIDKKDKDVASSWLYLCSEATKSSSD